MDTGNATEHPRTPAIFELMDPDGNISYRGEGAPLIEWWTRSQVVGANARVLCVGGGSADGTADGHLVEATRRLSNDPRGEAGTGDTMRAASST